MSFGFGVGDFLRAIELARTIRKEFVGAPNQFKDISDEVRSLSIVLQDVEVVLPEQELTSQQRTELLDIADGCSNVLEKLETTLGKYRELGSVPECVGKRVKRVWKRLKWEPKDIQELRSRISSNVTLLNAFNGRLTRDNTAKLVRHHEHQERRDIINWLTPIDYSLQQRDFIDRRQEGTGRWLLDSGKFQEWLNKSKPTLFCPGIPGAGKTMITAIVVDHLCNKFKNNASVGVAYVYCNFRNQDKQKPSDLLASLLRQLVQGQPSVPESVKCLYKCHGDKGSPPSDDILKALHAVITDYSKTFIIIDALDEYQASDGRRKKFLSEIFDLQAKRGASIFATSRFIPEIIKEFEGRSESLEIRASGEDVQRYLDGHMSRLPSFVMRNPNLQDEIRIEIMKAVDGMFLLAQLHLGSLIGKRSPKAIRAALKRLPKGSGAYDHAYKEAMERIEGQIEESRNLAKQVLLWITCAKQALTTLELRHALAVEIGESKLDEENLPEIEDLVSVCAGLVAVDEESDIIRLIHYTTQEYFERTQISYFPDAQRDIARACVTYVAFDVFQTGFCATDKDFETRLQSHALYEYAARYWGYHALAASIEEKNLILDFLESDTKVASASQALLTVGNSSGYSQNVPRGIRGTHLAAYFGLRDAMLALLNNGLDPDSEDSYAQTPLLWAARNGHEGLVELLVKQKVNGNAFDKWKKTALHYAACYGWTTAIDLLVKDHADVEVRDSQGQTPLLTAADSAQAEVVHLLLEAGADVKAVDLQGKGILHLAIVNHRSSLEMVGLLLEHGVPADTVDVDNMTPLHYTVRHNRDDIAKRLLQGGAPIDIGIERKAWRRKFEDGCSVYELRDNIDPLPAIQTQGIKGLTPLHYAAIVGSSKMTSFFLGHGANPNALSQYDGTPLHLSLCKSIQGSKYDDAWTDEHLRVEMLWDFVDFEEDNVNEISIQIVETRMAVVNAILSHDDTDVTVQDSQGRAPLHAVHYGDRASEIVISKLIRSGAKVSACNLKGQIALHLASLAGDRMSVSILLDHGVDLHFVDDERKSALHYAAGSGDAKTVSLILDACNVDTLSFLELRDNDGRNALHHSLTRDVNIEIIQLLLQNGANVRNTDNSGNSPLAHYLSQFRLHTPSEICRVLLQSDADALFLNSKGQNLAHLSAIRGRVDVDVLEVLMEFGVDMTAVDFEKRTLLHHVALSGSLTEALLGFLLDEGKIQLNIADSFGKTSLQYAIEEAGQKHHPDLFDSDRWQRTREILLNHGADVAR